jgi:hypothetical protein
MDAPLPDKKLGLDDEHIRSAFAELQPAIRILMETYNPLVVLSALSGTYLGLLQEAGLSQEKASKESRRIQILLEKHSYNRKAAASALEAIGHFCTRLSRRGIDPRVNIWIVGDALYRIVQSMRVCPAKKDFKVISSRLADLQIACIPANR